MGSGALVGRKSDNGLLNDDHYVMNSGDKAMVDLVGLARLKIDTIIHV